MAERLRDATLSSPVTATGNYSYEVKRATGRNYLLLGDAFTFIDPVFSTGVLFAMQSAFAGADTVEICLDDIGQCHNSSAGELGEERPNPVSAIAATDKAQFHRGVGL